MHAAAVCILIALSYVAPFYLLPTGLPRNHPRTVRRRMLCTAAVCAFTWVPLHLAVVKQSKQPWSRTLAALGLRWDGVLAAVGLPLLLTAALFLGPLLMWAWEAQQQRTAQQQLAYEGSSWLLVARNFVLGPITEEFVFRACMAPLLVLQGFSMRSTVLLTPLLFGIAHLHHGLEMVRFQGYKLATVLTMMAVQFSYTTLFGWYATFLFLRTGHLAAPVAVHCFCNVMGFPAFQQLPAHPLARTLTAAFVAGMLGFAVLVGPVTRPWLYHNRSSASGDNIYIDQLQHT